jgi:SAM-dependent methyltransferase
MKRALLEILRCLSCSGALRLVEEHEASGEIDSGLLLCRGCAAEYPVVRSIPRFVPSPGYTGNFGFQWNEFRRTQLDSCSRLTLSRDRFFRQTGWTPQSLRGRRVLDVGCGAGRFTEVALACGAEVFAIDYSTAVEACWANFESHPSLHVVQADLYRLPFSPRSFDDVYCFGVLQHTPQVKSAFAAVSRQVRPGGRLAVDVYYAQALNVLLPKYWLRPLTRRIPDDRLFPLVRLMVRALLPVSVLVGRTPWIGTRARQMIPVANYDGVLPLSRDQLYEWALLDTFDMLAPAYDQPQTRQRLLTWMREAGLEGIEVFRGRSVRARRDAGIVSRRPSVGSGVQARTRKYLAGLTQGDVAQKRTQGVSWGAREETPCQGSEYETT